MKSVFDDGLDCGKATIVSTMDEKVLRISSSDDDSLLLEELSVLYDRLFVFSLSALSIQVQHKKICARTTPNCVRFARLMQQARTVHTKLGWKISSQFSFFDYHGLQVKKRKPNPFGSSPETHTLGGLGNLECQKLRKNSLHSAGKI
uniref:Uncharacterized protein n=1 Tax=Romanomermis culicivorax TaxID=13658 RepID=A0A915IFT2_ROMCU